MTEQKWFERDELPRAVIDKDDDIWVYDIGAFRTGKERTYISSGSWYFAKKLEDCFGPCTPLVPETEQTEPLPVDTLTISAGELKRALELRMGEHARRIEGDDCVSGGGNYRPESAVKAGNMAQLALAISPNVYTTWALTPVKEAAQ